MKILGILVIVCTLLSVGCNSEKPNETPNYDAGIEAYKRGHYTTALYDFEKRAKQGDPVAQFCLGYMYKHGKGVKANNQTALDWYTKAAAQGHVPALNNRSLMYGQQAITLRLSLEGEAIERLIEGKDIRTYIDIEGKKIIDNLETSVEDIKKGIDQDDPNAEYNSLVAYNLALLQIEIVKVFFREDIEATAEWHETAVISLEFAAGKGYAPAQNQLATIYRDGLWGESPDIKKAEYWYSKAADKGFIPAQYNLAEMIWQRGGKENEEDSLEWYIKAADKGFAPAQYKLGQLYEDSAQNSKGDKKKEEDHWREAFKWFTKAAEQDDFSAKSALFLLYGAGKGVHENSELAMRWGFEAAQEGDAYSALVLAGMFESGNILPKDNVEAFYWYNLALKHKDTLKKTIHPAVVDEGSFITHISEGRDRVQKKLSEEQKRKIQKRVDSWKPRVLAASGTGFYIDKKHILTNAHVVTWEDPDGNKREFDEVRVGYRHVEKKPSPESVNHNVDLALLLDPRGSMSNFARFRNDPVDGAEGVISFGYPLSNVLSYRGNVTSGIVSGLSGTISDDLPENLFQHTAPIQGGNSGGPVFDLSGNVIGVTLSGLISRVKIRDDNIPQVIEIAPPQNVNFAIKFSVIEEFLTKNGVTPSTEDLEGSINDYRNNPITDDDRKKIYEKAQAFTLPVFCFINKIPERFPLHEISIKMLNH